jgi:hypothetical protein
MYEDKLTPEMRVRLEALDQANATLCGPMKPAFQTPEKATDAVLAAAARYEQFIKAGRIDKERTQ